MNHIATPKFWQCYNNLPTAIQNIADKNFKILKKNPTHPSLHFKQIDEFWSVRVGRKYRALAVEENENLLWFWIGTPGEYDELIK